MNRLPPRCDPYRVAGLPERQALALHQMITQGPATKTRGGAYRITEGGHRFRRPLIENLIEAGLAARETAADAELVAPTASGRDRGAILARHFTIAAPFPTALPKAAALMRELIRA